MRATSTSTSSSSTAVAPTVRTPSSSGSSRMRVSCGVRTVASLTQTTRRCGRWTPTGCWFLNPDTEVLEGSLGDLADGLRSRSSVGLVGVRQVTADGRLFPTIRRFPNAVRSLFEALGWSGTPSARRGSASVSWTCPSTSWTWSATGRQAPSCSYAARRCRAPGSWTSGSFSTARRQTCACASSGRAGGSGTCRR